MLNRIERAKAMYKTMSYRLFQHTPEESHKPCMYHCLQVVRGQARGRKFHKDQNYKAKKEFAYRMCAGRTSQCDAQTEFFCVNSPLAASFEPFRLVVVFWCSLVVCAWCVCGRDAICGEVVCFSVHKELLHTTKYYCVLFCTNYSFLILFLSTKPQSITIITFLY